MSSVRNFSIGIDIGTGGVKIVLLERSKEARLRLVRAECESFEHADPSDVRDQAAMVSYALKKFLRKEKRLVNARVGISIAGQSAFVRLVKIPATPPQKLRQIVLYETQQQVPFPIDDVVWDFQICSKDKKQLNILIAAVKKELVSSLLKVIEECSLEVEFIDVSNLALYNCLEYFYRDLKQTLILDFGVKTTNIVVVNSGKIWTRSLPIGGDDVTEMIAKELKVSREEAEILKKEKGKVLMLYYGKEDSPDSVDQKVAGVITAVLTDLTNEIVKTLNYYKSQYTTSIDFKKVLITGGLSKIKDIEKFFESSLAIPTEKISYFDLLKIDPKIDTGLNEFLGVALGSALRGFGFSGLNINLLPAEQLKIRIFRRRLPYLAVCAVILFLIIANALGFMLGRNQVMSRYLEALKSEIAKYQENNEQLNLVMGQIKDYRARLRETGKVLLNKHEHLLLLDALAEALPQSVWLEAVQADFRTREVELTGNCRMNLEDISAFQESLKQKNTFKSIVVKTVGRTDNGNINFSFRLELKPPEETN